MLTEKQSKVLNYIESFHASHGCPPTLREIAKHMGYSAVGTVQDIVAALRKKGFLENASKNRASRDLKMSWQSEMMVIPILGSVPAGTPREAIESSEGSLTVPQKLGKPGELYALKVSGDSMENAGILDGDLVIVKSESRAKKGDIVVAMMEDEATVKRLDIIKGSYWLMPENARYKPRELFGDRSRIVGLVVGVQRYY